MDLKSAIYNLSKEYMPEITGIRRHIHANPELSFKEFQTASYVAETLRSMGIEFQEGVADTGLVGLIKGKNPESRVVALRADMDALPIVEKTGADYASNNPGVMHACGHDVHTSSLLGAAKILSATREHWQGTIKLIFQPGEEKLPGGASLMIRDGVLENPRPGGIIGQHVFPDLPAGKVGFKPGLYMASADEIYMTITGRGGHGAMPHKNIDPILIASHVIIALQQVVSRNSDPTMPCVLSFGKIEGLGATNIIPNEVKLEGTFRTLNEEWRFKAHDYIRTITQSVVEGMGGKVHIDLQVGYPFLVNDHDLTLKSKTLAEDYLGAENVVDLSLRMTAEDFAYYSQVLPGNFYRLGTASSDGTNTYPLHHPQFNIDEKALETGMGLMAWLGAGV